MMEPAPQLHAADQANPQELGRRDRRFPDYARYDHHNFMDKYRRDVYSKCVRLGAS